MIPDHFDDLGAGQGRLADGGVRGFIRAALGFLAGAVGVLGGQIGILASETSPSLYAGGRCSVKTGALILTGSVTDPIGPPAWEREL